MSKDKVTISFSIPVEVKDMLKVLAERNYSSNTKYIVDMIRKDYAYWYDKKKEERKEIK